VRDTEAELASLVVVSPEGATTDILPSLARYPRPDVDAFYAGDGVVPPGLRTGFLATFVLPAPSRLGSGWKLELRNAAGDAVEAPAPPVVSDPLAARTAVLGDLAYDLAPDAPWRCPDECAKYERRLADVAWQHGSLVTPPSPAEPPGLDDGSAAAVLDEAENVINEMGRQVMAEMRAGKPLLPPERRGLRGLFRRRR